MKERSITTIGRRHLAGKRPLKEVGENRNSKEQETMRKPTWREVRAWETKEHARTFLPRRRPPSLAGKPTMTGG